MRRVQGTIGVALVECINHYIGKYRVRWDILLHQSYAVHQRYAFCWLDYEGLDKLERVRRVSENHLERRSVWI